MQPERGVLLYGGSFNPLHIGHMRLMLEALHWLRDYISHGEFVPACNPPHKPGHCLLPFDLRIRMIRAAIAGNPLLGCNEIEATLPGPSYTSRTLAILGSKYGARNLYFLLGSQDFKLLPEWNNGLELPALCNLVIAPRGEYAKTDFERQGHEFWPDCAADTDAPEESCLKEQGFALRFPCGTRALWLPLPYLEISATRIRKLWLCGLNMDYLTPPAVARLLDEESSTARQCWQEKECSK